MRVEVLMLQLLRALLVGADVKEEASRRSSRRE